MRAVEALRSCQVGDGAGQAGASGLAPRGRVARSSASAAYQRKLGLTPAVTAGERGSATRSKLHDLRFAQKIGDCGSSVRVCGVNIKPFRRESVDDDDVSSARQLDRCALRRFRLRKGTDFSRAIGIARRSVAAGTCAINARSGGFRIASAAARRINRSSPDIVPRVIPPATS